MLIKTVRQQTELQNLGQIANFILKLLLTTVEPGISTLQIDTIASDLMKANNVNSAPQKAYGFPGHTCISVNNVVAHGVPDDYVLRDGDMVNIDVSLERDDIWVDTGMSVVCGVASDEQTNLLRGVRAARRAAINAVGVGVPILRIAEVVEETASFFGLKVIENIGGHGVGNFIHEPPFISNCVKNAENHVLRDGEVIAIEPILSYDSTFVRQSGDWNLVSSTQSAQAEHTVIVGKDAMIIT